MQVQELVLDTHIRDYVLIPIVFLMFLVSMVRYYLNLYIGGSTAPDLDGIHTTQLLERSKNFRTHASRLPVHSYLARKAYFIHTEKGVLINNKDEESQANPMDAMANPLMDTSMMGTMMKKNLTMIVSNILLFTWVDRYLAGFLSVKLPFALTQGFKEMFQRGFDLQDLDVSYVSSMSWYILTLFGLEGLNSLILGSNTINERTMMQQQMTGGMGQQAANKDQLFKTEKEYIELFQHHWEIEQSETRLLTKYNSNK